MQEEIKQFGNRIFTDDYPKGYYFGQRAFGFPLNPKLRENLDIIKDSVLNKRNDFLIIIDGRVGEGKTTLATQIAKYLNPKNSLSKVCFHQPQLLKAFKEAKKGDVIMLDEAIDINSRSAMSQWNKDVMKILAKIRSKQLFIIFNLPSIFDLDRSIALHRASMLIHCYSPSFGKKGYFKAYFQKEIKLLYILGKKYYTYAKPYPNFQGTFSACFCLNEEEYERKKQASIHSEEATTIFMTAHQQRNIFIRYIRERLKMSYVDIAKLDPSGISPNAIGRICRGERGAYADSSDLEQNDIGGEKNE